MKEIKLTKGKVALVDDNDYEWINQWKWYANKIGNTYYALRTSREDDRRVEVCMHRKILGLEFGDGLVTDHINRNGLDNQRENLRITNKAGNAHNSKLPISNTSGYKGISWNKRDKYYETYIAINGKRIRLGYYRDIQKAIQARLRAEKKYKKEILSKELSKGF